MEVNTPSPHMLIKKKQTKWEKLRNQEKRGALVGWLVLHFSKHQENEG